MPSERPAILPQKPAAKLGLVGKREVVFGADVEKRDAVVQAFKVRVLTLPLSEAVKGQRE